MSKKKADPKKQKGGKSGPPRNANEVRIAEHPRARRQIGLAKSYAALGAFAFVAYSSWHGGAGFVDVAARSLLWGMTAYVLVWGLAVLVWRHLAVAEVRAAERRWRERREADEEQVRKLTKILDDNGMPTTGTGVPPA
jgi:hypothetical protein